MNEQSTLYIINEMRKHETGSASEAFYSKEDWRNLCDRLEASLKLKGDNIEDDRELVTELWRSGNNIGARFVFKKKDLPWQEMTDQQKEEVVLNMLQMGEFFMKFINQKKERK